MSSVRVGYHPGNIGFEQPDGQNWGKLGKQKKWKNDACIISIELIFYSILDP